MPATTVDLGKGTRARSSRADGGGLNSYLASISPPRAVPEDALLYKKLAANFDCIPELKSRLLEGERGFSCEVSADLHEHFDCLRPDFAGLPLLCFAHAQLIVCIRRKIDLAEHFAVFQKLWATEHEFLAAHLNSRWLVSACDSFADYGTDTQKAAAMLLVVLINTAKLAETERLWLREAIVMPEKLNAIVESHNNKKHIELWDGMMAYAPFAGDMPRNMFRRLAALTGRDPALATIARTLVRRAVAADTVLGRLADLNSGFLSSEFA